VSEKEPQTAAGREAGRELAGRVASRRARAEAGKRRVWCAFEADGSDFVLFGQQLPALEYAVNHHMGCKAVEFGMSLREQIK
jgi:hypothetical protein